MSGGRWEPVVTEVWDTVVTPCECCGQVVARRLWVVDVDGRERRFCGQRCEELYRTYVAGRDADPEHRPAAGGRGVTGGRSVTGGSEGR